MTTLQTWAYLAALPEPALALARPGRHRRTWGPAPRHAAPRTSWARTAACALCGGMARAARMMTGGTVWGPA